MTKTQPTHKKLPRGTTGYAEHANFDGSREGLPFGIYPARGKLRPEHPVAVIPCHTPAQAKQLVKAAEFLRLPEEGKVLALISVLLSVPAHKTSDTARAILKAMGMGEASK